MAIKWDKEKIILSVAGSLATIVLGYLVWRHEQTVQASEAQQQEATTEAEDEQLQQEISALPSYAQGGGASEESSDSGSDSNIEAPPTDSNIEAILAAFGLGTQTAPTSTPPTSTPTAPTPVTTPSGNAPAPPNGTGINGTPQLPITVVNKPPTVVPPTSTLAPPTTVTSSPVPVKSPNPSPIITRPSLPSNK